MTRTLARVALACLLLPVMAVLGQSQGVYVYRCHSQDGAYVRDHRTLIDAQNDCYEQARRHTGKTHVVKTGDLFFVSNAAAGTVVISGPVGGDSAPNVPAPPANIQPATVPIMLSAVNAENSPQFRFLEGVGQYDAANAHPGVASYDADCGSGVLSGLVDGTTWPLVAANPNVQGDWTLNDIGTTTPDPTATRVNTVDWDIVGPGNPSGDGGFDASLTHEIALLNRPITSTQALSVSLDTLTSPSSGSYPGEYDGAGIAIASSTASNAAFVAVVQTVAAGNKIFIVHVRRTAGGARESSVSASNDGSLYDMVLAPASCTGSGASTACTYSVYRVRTGAAELIHTTPSVTIGNSAIGGAVVYGLTTSQATARVSQLAIRTATPLTFNRTTSGTISCKVRSRALTSGVLSSWSNIVTGDGSSTPPPSGGISWNPGHYVSDRVGFAFDGAASASDPPNLSVRATAVCDLIEEIADEDNVQGIRTFMNIAQMFPTSDDPSIALTALDNDLDCAQANGKKLLWWFRTGTYATFSHPDITNDRYFPTWMRTGGYLRESQPGLAIEIDYGDLGTIWGDMMVALGEVCELHPACEGGTPNWEIATSVAPSAYTDAIAANTVALKAVMPSKNVWAGASFPPSEADAEEIVLAAAAVDAGYGDNDVQSNLITSVGYFTTYGHDAFFDNDLLNVVPFMAAIESSEIGDCSIGPQGGEAGPDCGYYPADLINYLQQPGIGASHVVWDKMGSSPDSGQNWSTGILPAIDADPAVNETCPSAYAGTCETGALFEVESFMPANEDVYEWRRVA